MQLVFRKISAADPLPPPPGDLVVRAREADPPGGRNLASLVVEHGVDALPRGPGAVERVIVGADATLDDLLAATFAMRLLAGKELLPGCAAFARYAGLVRQGLRPADVPLGMTPDGLFLAIRHAAGQDLTDPQVGDRFAQDWWRMAACILQAVAAGEDPFAGCPWVSRPQFDREQAFLRGDHELFREDVHRGQRWLVRLPGGPRHGIALVLRCPRSHLFKYWSRYGRGAAKGKGYVFLAVGWGEGRWVFSTDPVHRLPIRPLAELLQAAEAAANAARARADPWYDGQAFGHTVVAAPRGGTVLAEEEVLHIVKGWTGARPLRRGAAHRESDLRPLLRRLEHLPPGFRDIRDGVRRAIRIAGEDPEMALTRSRKVLELVVREVYERRLNEPAGTRPLENLLQRLVKDGFLPARLDAYANGVRLLGNVGTHRFGERITAADVQRSLSQLIPVLEWYAKEACVGGAPPPAEPVQQPAPEEPGDPVRGPDPCSPS